MSHYAIYLPDELRRFAVQLFVCWPFGHRWQRLQCFGRPWESHFKGNISRSTSCLHCGCHPPNYVEPKRVEVLPCPGCMTTPINDGSYR